MRIIFIYDISKCLKNVEFPQLLVLKPGTCCNDNPVRVLITDSTSLTCPIPRLIVYSTQMIG
jgi:hypothetical protein